MKDIVIIANFCRDFSETDNGRFMYLCKELSKEHQVEIITSDFNHGTKQHKPPLSHNWSFTITFLHEPGYKKNISIRRFISHYFWGKEVGKYFKKRKKPDVVYCAIPSLTAAYEVAKYCEKNNIRFIIDVQDLWPEAFRVAFNLPFLSNIIFAPFMYRANEIYRRAEVICGVSKTYVNRALTVNKKVKEGYVVFLGTQLSTFDKNAQKNMITKPTDEIWLVYCGSLTASYDINIVLYALNLLKNKENNVTKFIILGDGEKRKQFENHAKELEIDCLFTGRLPYDQMCGWLKACDIATNPIMRDAAQSIINKHGDYCAAGLPVINTQECQEYKDLVNEYQMGFNCNNENSEDIAEYIRNLITNEKIRMQMSKNARRCGEERFDRGKNYQKLIDIIVQTVK